jgi:glycosyltransferase involved in cell wall biosynthesis
VPSDVPVYRAFALDAQRHLSFRGRYPGALARPDRWVSWVFGAIPQILTILRKERPSVVWSTYPIATAHIVGSMAHRWSRLPWVADFRDPMAQDDYPTDPATWRSFARIEAHAVKRAAVSVFTTRSAAQTYRARYPTAADRIVTIENGYDEESFAGIDPRVEQARGGRITLLHSGVVYPVERDPSVFFAVLAQLKRSGVVSNRSLCVRFRASGNDALLRRLAAEHGIEDLIELAPSIPYRAALAEMSEVDGLLVLQASNCNEQIPAKAYEYLRTYRPLVGLADPAGDTGDLLRRSGVPYIAALHDPAGIEQVLRRYLIDAAGGNAAVPSREAVALHSRAARTNQLAETLDRLAGPTGARTNRAGGS